MMDVYTAATTTLYLAWGMAKEWAQSICSPYGKYNSCETQDDWDHIESGMIGFKRHILDFMTNIDLFKSWLDDKKTQNTLQRITQNEDSGVSQRHKITEGTECHIKQLEKTETVKNCYFSCAGS